MLSFCLLKVLLNELSQSKITNGGIAPPFMTFNVSYVIAKNHNKSGATLLSRSLVPLNELFDMTNKIGTSNVEQIFKMESNLRSRTIITT